MIITFDPSGNFKEGSGTTGINFMWSNGRTHKADEIHAGDYSSAEEYWNAHTELLRVNYEVSGNLEVVMEGFKLYGHKAQDQTNSILETPMLIGVIRYWCYRNGIPLKIQFASDVKTRWSDDVLEKKGYIYKKGGKRYLTSTDQILNNHKTDALRHALHYTHYTRQKHMEEWS